MSVLFEKLGHGVCRISLNRPNKRNAINYETWKLFNKYLKQFEEDDELTGAIISGVGGTFCSGYDLNEIVDAKSGLPKVDIIRKMLFPLNTRISKKTTIAAIDGWAVGLGFELAMRCDIRIIESNAKMGFLNRRFGIPIINGGTILTTMMSGTGFAKELLMTGRAINVQEAINHGFGSLSADIGCASGKALNIIRSFDKFNQNCLQSDLHLINESIPIALKTALNKERELGLNLLNKSESLEIALRFMSGTFCRHGKFNLGNFTEPQILSTL